MRISRVIAVPSLVTIRATRQVTIKDVAREAGVGLGTVSRVINNNPDVNEASRDRVLAVIDRLGYRPDLVARSMRAGVSHTLAFIVRDFTGATLGALADAVQKEVDGFGFSLFVASSYHDPARELAMLQRFKARRVDGIIVATSSESEPVLVKELTRPGPPVVLLDRAAPAELDAVQTDHAGGIRAAVAYLTGLRHRRIALITGEPDVFPTRDRIRGFREATTAARLPEESTSCLTGSFGRDFAYQQTHRLLSGPRRPTAIIAGGTALLPGVLGAVQELGLQIPNDLSLIGGADSDLARFASPPITVIHWDIPSLASTAARLIISRLADGALPPRRHVFPMELIVRASCGPPPRLRR